MKFRILSATALAACAVTPEPLAQAERVGRAQGDMAAMFVGQEAVSGPITVHEAIARARHEVEAAQLDLDDDEARLLAGLRARIAEVGDRIECAFRKNQVHLAGTTLA